MRITSYTGKEITISVGDEEFESVFAALRNGSCWLRNDAGKAQTSPAHEPLGIVDDPMQLELHWGKNLGKPNYICTEGKRGYYPSIYVQGISGYGDYYKENVKRLESAGFEVLRSRRGADGQIWEIWYLPSVSFARGPIKGRDLDGVRGWLCSLGVGSITIGGEHWGLGVD